MVLLSLFASADLAGELEALWIEVKNTSMRAMLIGFLWPKHLHLSGIT